MFQTYLTKRNDQIRFRLLQGARKSELARAFGLTLQRIDQIVKAHERWAPIQIARLRQEAEDALAEAAAMQRPLDQWIESKRPAVA